MQGPNSWISPKIDKGSEGASSLARAGETPKVSLALEQPSLAPVQPSRSLRLPWSKRHFWDSLALARKDYLLLPLSIFGEIQEFGPCTRQSGSQHLAHKQFLGHPGHRTSQLHGYPNKHVVAPQPQKLAQKLAEMRSYHFSHKTRSDKLGEESWEKICG